MMRFKRKLWPDIIACTRITNKDNHPSTNSPKDSQISHPSETTTFTNSEITTGRQESLPAFDIDNDRFPPITVSPSPSIFSGCKSPVWDASLTPVSDTFRSQSYCSPSDVAENKSAIKNTDHESFTTMARKDEQDCNRSCCSEEDDSPIYSHSKLMRRPKPYHEFLDEIEKQELEAKEDACRKAKHMKYMERLRQHEDCINKWEIKETSKIMNQMKETELKLEKERIKSSEKKQKDIYRIQNLAAEKKSRERRSISNKMSSVDKTTKASFITKSLTLLKLKKNKS